MLSPLPTYKPVVTLVPASGIQFLDFGFDAERVKVALNVWEERQEDAQAPEGTAPVVLRILEPDEERELYDPVTGAYPPKEEIYGVNRDRALETFNGRWVPVPLLRLPDPHATDAARFDHGPTNWARMRVVELAEPDRDGNTHRVVLAIDTEFCKHAPNRPYTGPTTQDSEKGEEFALATQAADMGWFLAEGWVSDWLEDIFRAHKLASKPGGKLGPSDFPHACEHWARYLAFLALIGNAVRVPRIKLADTVSRERNYVPIDVDLVLDLGNSRTCGILVEFNPDERFDLNDSAVLELRDLSAPEQVYPHPFESRLEFARPAFGPDHFSRKSGRRTAFAWPSAVRVGPEAVRLSGGSAGTEGATGLSSPKRYLWDGRPINQIWRFNGPGPDGRLEPPVQGPVMSSVTEDGTVISLMRRPGTSAVWPKFSRSSLFSFMLAEVLVQALVQMNAAGSRSRRRHADVPRRMRRIILTIPPATPLAEQRIFRQRARAAVRLVWEAMGWLESGTAPQTEPEVVVQWDEASCTQLVWLYTEITKKYQGDATGFFEVMGKRRGGSSAPTLRVASIDIGGGTTDLMVTTYAVEGNRALTPRQEFREGFRVAGDDILEAVVQRHVFPAIEASLQEAGLADAGVLLRQLFGGDWGGQAEQEKHRRMQFVTQVCAPVALGLLAAHEGQKPMADEPPAVRPFRDFIRPGYEPRDAVLAYLEGPAAERGAKGWSMDAVAFEADGTAVAHTVRRVLGPILNDLAEAVHALDCDALLLSGRPSRLPVVGDLLLARMPVPPNRIVPMHQYNVGNWYPFRDHSARIDDPKTTAAVGAMLCALAEGQIEGFLVRTSLMGMTSTARFIGEMELSGQMLNERLLFSEIDLEKKARAGGGDSVQLRFFAPTFIGFRQLPIERWPATPLYFLEFGNPQTARRMKLPLLVTLERADADEGQEDKKEDFHVTSVEDSEGTMLRPSDVALRLQTLRLEAGYWLDTGILRLNG